MILCSLYLFHKRKLFVYFPRVGVVNIDFILDDNDSTFFFFNFLMSQGYNGFWRKFCTIIQVIECEKLANTH